jgi:hypothetical protein
MVTVTDQVMINIDKKQVEDNYKRVIGIKQLLDAYIDSNELIIDIPGVVIMKRYMIFEKTILLKFIRLLKKYDY